MNSVVKFFTILLVVLGVAYMVVPGDDSDEAQAITTELPAQSQVDMQMQINDLKAKVAELDARCRGCSCARKTSTSRVRTFFFTTQNCQPCEQLKARINADLIPIGWTFGDSGSDIELTEDQAFADRMGVTSFPTVVVTVDGQEVSRTSGAGVSAGALSAWINQIRTQVK